MLNVIAYVKIKPGMLPRALEAYRRLLPEIRAHEWGCMAYLPGTRHSLGLPNEVGDDDTIVVAERWRSADDFRAHLAMPHTLEFRREIGPCLAEPITVQIGEAME